MACNLYSFLKIEVLPDKKLGVGKSGWISELILKSRV
jgi:hypothetical protein